MKTESKLQMVGDSDDKPPPVCGHRDGGVASGRDTGTRLYRWSKLLGRRLGVLGNSAWLVGVSSVCGWK